MNYIREINEFYVRLETNELTGSAIALWHALMHVNNRTRWRREFSVAASVLCFKAGLPLSTFKRARLELRDKGLIVYRPRGSRTPMYEMVSLVEGNECVSVGEEVVAGAEGESDVKTGSDGFADEQAVKRTNEGSSDDPIHIPNEVEGCVREKDNILPNEHGVRTEVAHHSEEVEPINGAALLEMMRDYLDEASEEVEENVKMLRFSTLTFYEENVGVPSAYVTDELYRWAGEMGDMFVYEAIVRAVDNGHLHWNYVRGILRNWQKAKLETMDDVLMAEENFRKRRGWGAGKQVPKQDSVLPSWWEDRKSVG